MAEIKPLWLVSATEAQGSSSYDGTQKLAFQITCRFVQGTHEALSDVQVISRQRWRHFPAGPDSGDTAKHKMLAFRGKIVA
jgi:hypothetical protein